MSGSKEEDITAVFVTSKVLADIFGVTDRQISNLAKEGIAIKGGRGRYKLGESTKNYIRQIKMAKSLREESKSNNQDVDYELEHALLERAKREKEELKLAVMRGELHEAKDVERVMTDMLARFKSKAISLPAKIAPQLEGIEANEIKSALLQSIKDVLSELSEYNPEDFYSDQYIEVNEDGEN